jgi:asparagine synthase (glutamine-hydrolysing)
MCGLIAGLLAEPRLQDSQVSDALTVLRHRGPERTSFWFDEARRTLLGHVRLSIIGVDNGDQPLVDAAADLRCVVNGEFYGYRAIRASLAAEGRRFATESDSEIALQLYDKLGPDCLHQLRGEFAFVIADRRRRCLFAARDRFGVKPLYYAVHRGDVLIASEIKALFELGVPARWDEAAYFAECHGVRPAHRTLFAGIYAVPPGCYLIARDGSVNIHSYWDLEFPDREQLARDRRSDLEVAAGLRELLDQAVAERMVADVEVAAYLSGGIDSCAVLGLAQRRSSRPIRAFTIVFDDAMYGEERQARETAAFVGAEFTPVPVTQSQLADAMPAALWHAETLLINGHAVAKYLLSRAVRDAGIKVVLTGEGADEVFAGYPPFRCDKLLHDTKLSEAEAAKLRSDVMAANQSSRGLFTPDGETAPGLPVLAARLGWVPSALGAFSTLAGKMIPLFDTAYLYARTGSPRDNPYAQLLDSIDVPRRLTGKDPLNQSLYLWSRTQLPTYILTALGDRMEMAHSVEGRVPFLDHRVAEYAAALPIEQKIRGTREKHVLREAVADCVLPEIYARQKHPFMSPPARNDDDPLAQFCNDVLHSSAARAQPFFDPRRLRNFTNQLRDAPAADRAAAEAIVLRVVSTILLHQKFRIAS